MCLFQFNRASICTPMNLVTYTLSRFSLLIITFTSLKKVIPRHEYHIMGLRYIQLLKAPNINTGRWKLVQALYWFRPNTRHFTNHGRIIDSLQDVFPHVIERRKEIGVSVTPSWATPHPHPLKMSLSLLCSSRNMCKITLSDHFKTTPMRAERNFHGPLNALGIPSCVGLCMKVFELLHQFPY